ncbi:hypothetical protein Tco_0635857 [Tanacetum coccineum]
MRIMMILITGKEPMYKSEPYKYEGTFIVLQPCALSIISIINENLVKSNDESERLPKNDEISTSCVAMIAIWQPWRMRSLSSVVCLPEPPVQSPKDGNGSGSRRGLVYQYPHWNRYLRKEQKTKPKRQNRTRNGKLGKDKVKDKAQDVKNKSTKQPRQNPKSKS